VAKQKRLMVAKMSSADLAQTKGVESALVVSMQCRLAQQNPDAVPVFYASAYLGPLDSYEQNQ
jgi:hypothetical protein